MLSKNLSFIPPDPMFELTKLFNADTDSRKVSLGAGTYKDNEGQPFVFPSVKEAKKRLIDGTHEYLPILGLPSFRQEATKLVFGEDSAALKEGRIATSQSLSGTGSLHLAGSLLRRVFPPSTTIYITSPTWSNHQAVFSTVGFPVKSYSYLTSSGSFDFSTLTQTLSSAPPSSIFVFHASGHNPSGYDPSPSQWREIASLMKQHHHFPIFDAAYLGLTTGSFETDIYAIRYFAEQKFEMGVCLSFAKVMGLYSERVGLIAFVTSEAEEARIVESNLEQVMRAEISNPPAFGARVVAEVLGDGGLRAGWIEDLGVMAERLQKMRARLVHELEGLDGGKRERGWGHVVEQKGMFSILGLDVEQVKILREKYHIYMADSSRISVAGLNEGNVRYVAESIHAVCS